MNNIKKFGKISTFLEGFFLSNPESFPLWNQYTFRQEHPLSPHKDTEAIYLRWSEEMSAKAAVYDLTCQKKEAEKYFPDILWKIEEIIKTPILRAAFVKLNPGGSIAEHADGGPWAEITSRFHIGINLNAAQLFVENEQINILPGEIFWFNKHVRHAASNPGKNARIHLIIDTERQNYDK